MIISLGPKTRLMRSLVTSIFLHARESWTVTAEPVSYTHLTLPTTAEV